MISPAQFKRKWRGLVLGIALVLVPAAYLNALHGEFVYDDQYEIVNNPYIQHPRYLWKAVTSDVWAFTGDRGSAWSNYWRPMFVLWMAANYHLFGLATPGWHVTSIVAHLIVVVLIYVVFCQLRARPVVIALVVWLFAVHPTHVESVAWASGVPNMLMSGFVLGSYACYLKWRRVSKRRWFLASTALFLLALLSKEGAIVYPIIIFLTEWAWDDPAAYDRRLRVRSALCRAFPFLLVAVVFVIARYEVLGMMRRLAPGAPSLSSVLATAPSIVLFYIRQMMWPVGLGPIYSLRAVNNLNMGWGNFWLPLLALLILARLVSHWWDRDRILRIGLIWFAFALLLSLDVRVFIPEEIVHDRYLYLPLWGGLAVICTLVDRAARRLVGRVVRARQACLSFGIVTAVVFAVLTHHYNPVWGNEVALWARGVQSDPTSAYAAAQHGEALRRAGYGIEARAELERSLAMNPNLRTTNLSLAMLAIRERQYVEAERLFLRVLDRYPEDDVAREQLAFCYQQQGRLSKAIEVFDEGRRLLPYKRDVYTVNIAVIHQLDGRPDRALHELESIRDLMLTSTNASVLRGWYFLGELYRESGRLNEAESSYRQLIEISAGIRQAEVRELRDLAEHSLHAMQLR